MSEQTSGKVRRGVGANIGGLRVPAWNLTLFLLINARGNSPGWEVRAVTLLAKSPLVIGPAVLVALWVWGVPRCRGPLICVAAGMVLAQGANQVLGLLWFEPRPFMIGLGQTLMAHAPDNSFPSDHAAFVWSLGLGLILTGAARRGGIVVCAYGVAVAWSRMWLGVHFPFDMVGAAGSAVVGASVARWVRPIAMIWVIPAADRMYEGALRSLHLPPAVFPRHGHAIALPLRGRGPDRSPTSGE